MSDARRSLVGLSTPEILEVVTGLGESSYRAKQLASWIYGRAEPEFDRMGNLPSSLRQGLSADHVVNPTATADHQVSSDGTEKLLVRMGDGEVCEAVLLPFRDRVSCCLSSQIGCPMGCTFCATGLGGFARNLTPGEIVGQYLLLQRLSERRIGHVVFMGMGEPLLNLDHLVKAMALLHEEVGLSYRHITVSTVGMVPQIRELAELKLPIHLALSLHSPFDAVRDELMPVNSKWPVEEVVGAMRDYQYATRRKVTFEYLLIDGVNDLLDQAVALARLTRGIKCVINLIPFNYVDTPNGFKRPKSDRIRRFRAKLESLGATVTQRVERGHDIAAACGQLAGQSQGRLARRSQVLDLQQARQ